MSSLLRKCIDDGEVKKVVDSFVDDYENMFDCVVLDVDVVAVDTDGDFIGIRLRHECEEV